MSDYINDSVERWLFFLSDYMGAELLRSASGWNVKGASDMWRRYLRSLLTDQEKPLMDKAKAPSVSIRYTPKTKEQWQDRLRIVEKSAAKVLTNAPVAFRATLHTTKDQGTISVIRLSFGYSLSLGRRIRRRFTAYYIPGRDESFFRRGDDRLLDNILSIKSLNSGKTTIHRALGKLLNAAIAAEQEYRRDTDVEKEMARIQQKYEEELHCLDRLYTSNSGQGAPLLGIPASGLKGDAAVEAEYVSRLKDIVGRYQIRILFEPLTIGIVNNCDQAKLLMNSIRL